MLQVGATGTKQEEKRRYQLTSSLVHHVIVTDPKTPWLLVRTRTIPTERPPLVGEVSANFCR
jgi:hypothetical protein